MKKTSKVVQQPESKEDSTKTSEIAQIAHALGNTISNALKKKPSRYRKWCFTLNNYTENDFTQIHKFFDSKRAQYIIGDEIGEQGTKHYQGYVEFRNGVTMERLKKINERIHWESTRGSREQNIIYCSKEKVLTSTFKTSKKDLILSDYINVSWKPWQQDIIRLVRSEPDNRSIYWYWEPEGNVGKSFLVKYLCVKYDALMVFGKAADIKHAVATNEIVREKLETYDEPLIVIMNVPRHASVDYKALEQVKDGLFFTGKYDSTMVYIYRVHLIVLSNSAPETSNLSQDRWKIIRIEE